MLARKNAKTVVFDEPEAGIDLWSFASLIEAFKTLKKSSERSLLIISHQERIMDIADRIVVIANGKVRTEGDAAEVLPSLLENEKSGHCPLGKNAKETY